MAYRKLAIELRNRGLQARRADTLFQKAYDHRDRLSDSERYITLGSYFSSGPPGVRDRDKAIAAYESLLQLDSTNTTALNNLGVEYRVRRDFPRAEQMYRRSIALDPGKSAVQYSGLVLVQIAQGKLADAEQTVAAATAALPTNPAIAQLRASFAATRGVYDSAAAIHDSLIRARPNDAASRRVSEGALTNLSHLRGKVREAATRQRANRELSAQLGNPGVAFLARLDEPLRDLWFRGNTDAAKRALDRIVADPLFDSLPPGQRNYPSLVTLYAYAGDAARARSFAEAWERIARAAPPNPATQHAVRGDLAMAERRYDDAVREYLAARVGTGSCTICDLPTVALAYDAAGTPTPR